MTPTKRSTVKVGGLLWSTQFRIHYCRFWPTVADPFLPVANVSYGTGLVKLWVDDHAQV
jgi:hypothetical protein